MGVGAEIETGVTLAASTGAQVLIGDDVFVGHYSTIAARGTVSIGSGSMLAEFVSIRDHDHDPSFPPKSGRTRTASVTIDEDVWIANKVTIARGVHVGRRSVLAAHAVVLTDVPAGALVGGIPARVLREPGFLQKADQT